DQLGEARRAAERTRLAARGARSVAHRGRRRRLIRDRVGAGARRYGEASASASSSETSFVSRPMTSAVRVSIDMTASYTPTQNGLPSPTPHSHTAMNGATAAPRIDDTLYEMPEPV